MYSFYEVFFPNVVASSIILILLYLPYKLFCANQNQPTLNRITIMAIYLVALTAWSVYSHFHTTEVFTQAPPIEIDIPYYSHDISIRNATPERSTSLLFILIYILGVLAMLVKWFVSFSQIHDIKWKCRKIQIGGRTINVSRDFRIAPFSVFGIIIIPETDLPEADMIVEHEKIHVRRGHSFDMLFAQLVATIQWFNPAAWLMMRELRTVHELEADAGIIDSGIDMKQYQLLLIKKAAGKRFPSPANSLSHSNLKTRITMMKVSKSSGLRRWGAALLLPAVIGALAVTNIPAVATILRDAAGNAPGVVYKITKISPSGHASVSFVKKVFAYTAEMPKFPGGDQAMMQYLADNIRYPESAMKAGEQGCVDVQFVILEDGSIGETNVVRSISPALDEEAIRVVKSFPRFTPGKEDGRPVSGWYTLPVNFNLSDDDAPAATAADE